MHVAYLSFGDYSLVSSFCLTLFFSFVLEKSATSPDLESSGLMKKGSCGTVLPFTRTRHCKGTSSVGYMGLAVGAVSVQSAAVASFICSGHTRQGLGPELLKCQSGAPEGL